MVKLFDCFMGSRERGSFFWQLSSLISHDNNRSIKHDTTVAEVNLFDYVMVGREKRKLILNSRISA
jgi:hypothetical protein